MPAGTDFSKSKPLQPHQATTDTGGHAVMKTNLVTKTTTGLLGFALAIAGVSAQTVVEDFEFATDDTAAQTGTTVFAGTTATIAAGSGSGGDASEGSFSLRNDIQFTGTAFDAVTVERFLSSPYILTTPIADADLAADFAVRLDIKGHPDFGLGASGTNIWVRIFDNDGDQFQFINFTDSALAGSSYTIDHPIAYFNNSTVVDGILQQVNAVQIIFQDSDGDSMGSAQSIFLDKLEFEELGGGGTVVQIDDFEFADSDPNAAAGVFAGNSGTVTVTPRSGSGANANEGSFALGVDLAMSGTAFEFANVDRTPSVTPTLSQAYNEINPSGSGNINDLQIQLDIAGDPAFASTQNTSIWIRFNESDGDTWRFINFSDPVFNTTGFTDDHTIAFFDREVAGGDGNFTEVVSYQILFQNPDAVAKTGIIYVDDFKIVESTGSGSPTGLTYVVPQIAAIDAPNVTDSTFDAIYSNSGGHPVITGDDWKDWAQRLTDAGAPISTQADSTAAAGIGGTSAAYLISDGTYLYFGMTVWDPNTGAMTADSGDDTFTKFNVEDIEVAFSALSGTAGAGDAAKIVMDAFGNIDDMIPDGTVATDTTAKVNSNSYIIDSNTWALEWRVGIQELITLTTANLTNPLPDWATTSWYGHIGYQSPFSGSARVPLYAAGHANGFGNYTIEFDLTGISAPSSVTDWQLLEY